MKFSVNVTKIKLSKNNEILKLNYFEAVRNKTKYLNIG